jgi:hypothetical protein
MAATLLTWEPCSMFATESAHEPTLGQSAGILPCNTRARASGAISVDNIYPRDIRCCIVSRIVSACAVEKTSLHHAAVGRTLSLRSTGVRPVKTWMYSA